ncbi:16S rRNA (cytosine(1402)-N(4))-methyltransferase [Subtercola boreus]|uniref:Ribosomal RNA small subunit methyltransferase H n=1 Tax=Subtercola boreus TaxID=120213 RepID=A0A3E0VGS0_9MICO|nr:16S rRNA (cytosine(1402)-N(4))-methyltransferase RsmH [Subtercola boreus]RFA09146.1 16S rRNA (cytosine(1402)-N(4))-methyltransferase [Subtercola boreus]TQL53842.1 16S rRNA (cytosine1402-N4)-methyltransferase [Subtercola boreus]
MEISRIHTPVMLERSIELLRPAIEVDGAVLVDGTLGLGGHAEAFLTRFPNLTLVGLDRDPEALALAGERLAPFGERAKLVHCRYDEIRDALQGLGYDTVQGILLDLGVSSMQLDRAERGFAYSKDAPLDMRMDGTAELTAEEILAEYSEHDLRRIFWEYGEERLASRFARRIVERRGETRLVRSAQLVDLLSKATPAALARQGHPAKRVFQALRIEVNQELASLEEVVPRAIESLALGGRMVVLSYQSLEDRIVKRALAAATTSSTPPGLPVELPEHQAQLRLLVRGAELATEDEKAANPRSTPVRLRAAERVRVAS